MVEYPSFCRDIRTALGPVFKLLCTVVSDAKEEEIDLIVFTDWAAIILFLGYLCYHYAFPVIKINLPIQR